MVSRRDNFIWIGFGTGDGVGGIGQWPHCPFGQGHCLIILTHPKPRIGTRIKLIFIGKIEPIGQKKRKLEQWKLAN